MTSKRKILALLIDIAHASLEASQWLWQARIPSLFAKGGRDLGFSALTLLTLAGRSAYCQATVDLPTAPQAKFAVFDATLYKAKPDLAQFGLTPITVAYPQSIWPGTSVDMQQKVPAAAAVQKIADSASQSTGIVVVDTDQWSPAGDAGTVAQSVAKYQQTLQMFRQDAPSLQVGYYAIAPIRNYWDVMAGPRSAKYLAWQQENDAVVPIVQQADALFLSLHTFYKDQAGWQEYAIANIAEARRIASGKPDYFCLWPRYDDGKGDQGGEYLPDVYWKMELETAKQYADGVVIWGGSAETWDDNASWWLDTQQFMTEIGANQSANPRN